MNNGCCRNSIWQYYNHNYAVTCKLQKCIQETCGAKTPVRGKHVLDNVGDQCQCMVSYVIMMMYESGQSLIVFSDICYVIKKKGMD